MMFFTCIALSALSRALFLRSITKMQKSSRTYAHAFLLRCIVKRLKRRKRRVRPKRVAHTQLASPRSTWVAVTPSTKRWTTTMRISFDLSRPRLDGCLSQFTSVRKVAIH
eukprot:XP_001704077.1 Hypothetical protein GL50803_31810 [Giardia lamblia ATCC 50803]